MSTAASSNNARAFFGPRGALSRWHPNYEYRPGQLDMAQAVEKALEDDRHLIVEAGTGTGKTLAYLVPAILSGRRVVISTGTKNLQEQLFFKDVPFLQKHFARPLSVAYMKGRNNYLCRQKLYDAEKEQLLDGLQEIADYQAIREWEKTTETGDRAEIRILPEQSTTWNKLDARRDTCTGQKCPQYGRCFLTLMHQKARESDIIIVNHHLLFADLAVREDDFGGILPDYTALILDEAHEVEDTAGTYFGVSISSYQVQDLRRDVLGVLRRKQINTDEIEGVLIRFGDAAEMFFALFPATDGRTGFVGQGSFLERHGHSYREVLAGLELIWTHLELIKAAPEETLPLLRRAREMHQDLTMWMEGGDPAFVYWIERRGRGCYLQATPIDVSSLLAHKLFDKIKSVVLTSATLTVAGSFDFVQQRLGVPEARTLLVSSPYDYGEQALLYVPQHLPDPRDAAFPYASWQEILRLLRASQGRAFVLFTSVQAMRNAYDRISEQIEYPTLMQGTGPRHALLEEFRSTPNAILFATASFWQGVDVPGDQLSCVIIDKLPFAVPSDPVVQARIRMVREAGGEPFREYQIPQAAIALKQGFGRLIRGRSDRGVLVLLDNRITRQRYGQIFFDSLPDYGFTVDWNDVERFFLCMK